VPYKGVIALAGGRLPPLHAIGVFRKSIYTLPFSHRAGDFQGESRQFPLNFFFGTFCETTKSTNLEKE